MADDRNAQSVRRMYQAIEDDDLTAAQRLAADAEFTQVPFGQTMSLADDLAMWFEAFPDGTIELRSVVSQGELVVVEAIARGTHTGPLPLPEGTIAPTGRRVELPFLDIYEMASGKICRGRMYFDALGLLRQLGLGQRPAVAPESAPAPAP